MREFKPTYLYIKRHRITGKLYFGKTVANYEEMLTYFGSGKYWQNHIMKHSKEYVETVWFCLFYDKEECKKFAEIFSEQEKIVESKNWANLRPENGLNGGGEKGRICSKHAYHKPRTAEHTRNLNESRKKNNKLKKELGVSTSWNTGLTKETSPKLKETSKKIAKAMTDKKWSAERKEAWVKIRTGLKRKKNREIQN